MKQSSTSGWSVRRVTRLAFLTAVGTALFVLESLVPLPLPFLKIGLANISTLLALLVSGPLDALTVVFLRIMAGSLLTGSFLGPSFVLAFAAGLVSALVMSLLRTIAGRALGPVGLSLSGSTAHVLTQLTIVALVYVRNGSLFHLLPLLLLTALVGGLVVGLMTSRLLPILSSPGSYSAGHGRQLFRETSAWDRVALLALTVAIACSFILTPDRSGSTVIVEVDGNPVGKLSLLENQELTVRGEKGNVVVEVLDGKVRVREANCPNRICVRTGWRSHEGDAIVCVPNRTVVRILGGDNRTVKGITG